MASTAALPLSTDIPLQPATVPPGPRLPQRPRLRVLEGGQAPARRARRATYRRRRLVVASLLVLALTALGAGADAAIGAISGGGAAGDAAGSVAAVAAHDGPTHIVQPGDTLWSIAEAVAPDVDVRITVDRLVELNGSAPITVGQRLLLP